MEIALTIVFFGIIWGIMALSPYFTGKNSDAEDCDTEKSMGGCAGCGSQGSCGLYQAVAQKAKLTEIKKIQYPE
jgi:hypothetical protein